MRDVEKWVMGTARVMGGGENAAVLAALARIEAKLDAVLRKRKPRRRKHARPA